MTNDIIAQSSDRSGWLSARVGRFTASTFGDLIQEDSGRLKKKIEVDGVVFGGTGITLIQKIAMQRITGLEEQSPSTKQTERGELLEEVALAVLNRYWKPVSRCAFIEAGDFAGASPDFVTDEGEATGDIKCPWNAEKFMEFVAVADDDHEALMAYDKGYYWQIMMQAWCAGVKTCYLALFDDRQPLLDIDPEWLMQETGYAVSSGKCAWVVRKFTLTDEVADRIKRTLAAAEYLCRHFEQQYRDSFVAPVDDEEMRFRIEALVDYGWERADDVDGSSYIALGERRVLLTHVSRMSDAEYMSLLSDGLDEVLTQTALEESRTETPILVPDVAEESAEAVEQAVEAPIPTPIPMAAEEEAAPARAIAATVIPETDLEFAEWLRNELGKLREAIHLQHGRSKSPTYQKDMIEVDDKLKYASNWLGGAIKDR